MDVLQAAQPAVEAVFRFSITEDPPLDGDLIVVDLERLLAIGEGQRDLGHADGWPVVGSVEDDIGHLTATQGFGGGLAKNPADRVDHV